MAITLRASSTAAAVVYTAATATPNSLTAVVASDSDGARELVGDNDKVVVLAQATDIGGLLAAAESTVGLVSALVEAKDLISLIPTLRSAARQKNDGDKKTPALVIHVAVRAGKRDIGSVLAMRDSGCAILRSTSQQDAVDFALAASVSAQQTGVPVVHCFPASSSGFEFTAGYDSAKVCQSPAKLVSYAGAADASVVFVTFGDVLGRVDGMAGVGVVQVSLARPFDGEALRLAVPASATRVVALEQNGRGVEWGALFFDLALVAWEEHRRPILLDAANAGSVSASHLQAIAAHARTLDTAQCFDAGTGQEEEDLEEGLEEVDEGESLGAYGPLLRDVFGARLRVANASGCASVWGAGGRASSRPEFGFGRLAAAAQERAQLAEAVTGVLRDVAVPLPRELHAALATWLGGRDDPGVASVEQGALIEALIAEIKELDPKLEEVSRRSAHFPAYSRWLVGGDAWASDIGGSGVHHVLSSGGLLGAKMLVLDSGEYSGGPRKKDIGLYAMNYGSAYVASVAVYASYAQVLQALAEADAFPGPAVVVAHLPRTASPIAALQQSKRAVDSGAWPLYRWDPRRTQDPFQLDSEELRRHVADFLRRDAALVGLAAPRVGAAVAAPSVEAKAGAVLRARGDVSALLSGVAGPPLLVLFASDGGSGEEAARRVARGGRRRGMRVRCVAMDAFDADELGFEPTVVVVASTAGQGEIPAAGREFLRALLSTSANLSQTGFAVFGLGDSHYWPRAEDAVFFNKPARDIDRRLAELGARRIAGPGLGDDQDADGWQAAFGAFDAALWQALSLDVTGAEEEAEAPRRTDEENKAASNFLRGTIAASVADAATADVGEWDGKLLKFHGTYMQDDRDVRADRLARGEEKAFSFMIRVRLPGGVATPAQWLAMDALADEHGNASLKITTRQTFQLHGVLKRNLRASMRAINRALMDTIAACGDVNRNVVASANPQQAHLQPEVARLAADISAHLLPATSAYHEIWLADELVAGSAEQTLPEAEPLYGPAYLPRKYKIAIAIPPENDVDVFAYDLGYIAILGDSQQQQQQQILGYNVVIGGGMGMTHNNKATYPRLASCLGYVPKDRAVAVAEKVMLVQRDHGDRADRKHARLKYTVDDHGMAWWREQVEERLGFAFEPARPYAFARNGDRYGWTKSTPGLNNFTMFIQNGRVSDLPGSPLKSALASVARVHTGNFRLTCNGHLIVADVRDEDVGAMTRLLASHRLDNLDYSALRLHSMACVALPTCGLAMAESERYLPRLIDLLDKIIDSAGLRSDAIVIRMTGCPNGCARPYNAEIAF
ncbi:Sulfite reductase [NADPH] subunit beta, partial [Coemansia aciculifera]